MTAQRQPTTTPTHHDVCDDTQRTATLIVLIGFSRLSLGVHYVSDVLGGYVLGAAWLIASVAAFEIWREERGRPRTRPLEHGVEPEEGEALVETGTAT